MDAVIATVDAPASEFLVCLVIAQVRCRTTPELQGLWSERKYGELQLVITRLEGFSINLERQSMFSGLYDILQSCAPTLLRDAAKDMEL